MGNFFSLGLDIFQEKEEGADPNSNSLSNFCLFENSSEHVSNMSEPTIRGGGAVQQKSKDKMLFLSGASLRHEAVHMFPERVQI